jgi:hypothetical protein
VSLKAGLASARDGEIGSVDVLDQHYITSLIEERHRHPPHVDSPLLDSALRQARRHFYVRRLRVTNVGAAKLAATVSPSCVEIEATTPSIGASIRPYASCVVA